MRSTAGKGPGLALRTGNRSGVVHLSLGPNGSRVLLEVLESGGEISQIGLSLEEIQALAHALDQLARAIAAIETRQEERSAKARKGSRRASQR